MDGSLAADSFPQTFDLAPETAYLRQQVVMGRLAAAVVGAAIVGFALYVLRASNGNSIQTVPLFVFGAVFLCLAAAVRPRVMPAGLTIASAGLTIRFSDGTQRQLRWTDPSLAFRVIDRSADYAVSPEERAHLDIEFAAGYAGTISKSVLLALDDAALEFRFPRMARKEKEKIGKRYVIRRVVRFGEASRTPRWADVQEVPAG